MSAALLGAASLATSGSGLAAEPPAGAADSLRGESDSVAPPAEPLPSAEMLLYFAEFEDNEGDFVDPLALESAEAGQLEPKEADHKDAAVDEQAPRPH